MSRKISFGIVIVVLLGAVVAGLVGTKALQFSAMGAAAENGGPPPETVSTHTAETRVWETELKAVGSIEPVEGVQLEAEVPGIVREIAFANGARVERGDLLVQLDVSVERAELRAARASADLAAIEYKRAKRLRAGGNVPQSELDRAEADLERARAEVANLRAVIGRKTIRAPFGGRAGIRRVNLGQYLPAGAPVVTLQARETVFVNFTLPQQALPRVGEGFPLEVTSDAFPEKTFTGEVTAVSPEIDPVTRSVEIQGTLENESGHLRPGLFVRVEMTLPAEAEEVLVVPATAIVYAPYGNSVYTVAEEKPEGGGGARPVARQAFVRIGEHKGDFVSIREGLAEGDTVVSAGAFKLSNGAPVRVNNELAPEPKENPEPDNS